MTKHPSKLKAGDLVRFVSPASPTPREEVFRRAALLEGWGLRVDFGQHVFEKCGYLAGTDDQRLADLNAALADPRVRAIFATRGGKGSYRIADRLDFAVMRADPKFIVGFSDITILHLSANRESGLVGIHGALPIDDGGDFDTAGCEALRAALMLPGYATVRADPSVSTSALTSSGTAHGRLIGGNLDMVATAAGWALPDLRGGLLFLEAIGLHLGHIDRLLTMLRKAGHLDGIEGIALGQFIGFDLERKFTVIDLLREHFSPLGVPILGGLPLGHGPRPVTIPIGSMASLDADAGTLAFTS